MRYDNDNKRIYVRQSWLGSYLICPQRGRYDLTMPSLRRGSDATAIGTGVHSAIEQYLTNKIDTWDQFLDVCRTSVKEELDRPDLRRSAISADLDNMFQCVDAMASAWWDDIRQFVPLGGLVEHKFSCPVGGAFGVELWLEGTMDYVAPDGTIWDWKTSSRVYSPKEKQKQSHQATCYILAGRTLGLIPSGPEPSLFRFGVMVRQRTPKAQIVTVTRDDHQLAWLQRQMLSVVNTATVAGNAGDWAMNDQHNLCSSQWCDYWSICKGAHWSDDAMEPPRQDVGLIVQKPAP